jgi:hypothetical protein
VIEFFREIKEFTELSATRFVLEKTGEKLTRNDYTELEYLPPSWLQLKLYQRYACSCGWNATTNNIGAVDPIPWWAGELQLHLAYLLLLLVDELSKVEGKKADQRHLQYVLRFSKHSQICKMQTTLHGACQY